MRKAVAEGRLQERRCRAQGHPPTDIHLPAGELAGASMAFQQQRNEQLLALPLQWAAWWQLVDPYTVGVQGLMELLP